MWLLWLLAFIGLPTVLHLPLLWEPKFPSDLGPRQMLQDLYPSHKLYIMTKHVLSRCKDEAFCDVCGLPLEVGDTVISVKSGRYHRKFYHFGNPSSPSCYRRIYPIDQEVTITAKQQGI